jgi:acetyl esterase/lipase
MLCARSHSLRQAAGVVVLAVLLLAPQAFADLLSYKNILARAERPQADFKIPYGGDPGQYGELWLPKGASAAKRVPVVLMIHGGCWLADLPGPELLAFQADALRAAGVAVWSISYRRLGHAGGGYPGTFLDAANGADKLRELAEDYPLDLANVVATGHSAGGHLALWLAARPNIAAGSELKTAKPLAIRAVVSVAGVPDLAYASTSLPACGDHLTDKLVDRARREAKGIDPWQDTSPAALLPLKVKQTLISGDSDPIVSLGHAHRYQTRAASFGEQVAVVDIANAGHFELISPWTPQGRQVVDLILEATRTSAPTP